MKKALLCLKIVLFNLFLVCLYMLICKLMYGRGKTVSDFEQDEKIIVSDEFNSESVTIEDAERESEDVIAEIAYKRASSIDFTAKEYMLNTEVYTKEMNEE